MRYIYILLSNVIKNYVVKMLTLKIDYGKVQNNN